MYIAESVCEALLPSMNHDRNQSSFISALVDVSGGKKKIILKPDKIFAFKMCI